MSDQTKEMKRELKRCEDYAAHYAELAEQHRAAGMKHLCGMATAARNDWQRRAEKARDALAGMGCCPA
jgi:pyruvate-formate lyase